MSLHRIECITQDKLPAMFFVDFNDASGMPSGHYFRTGRRGMVHWHRGGSIRAHEYRTTLPSQRAAWLVMEDGRLEILADCTTDEDKPEEPEIAEFTVELPRKYRDALTLRETRIRTQPRPLTINGNQHYYKPADDRCHGGCSRGGDGPACGKPGCQG